MKTVRISSPFKDTSGLLVNNLHLIIQDDIFNILIEKCPGFEKLGHGMDPFRFNRVILKKPVLKLKFFLVAFS